MLLLLSDDGCIEHGCTHRQNEGITHWDVLSHEDFVSLHEGPGRAELRDREGREIVRAEGRGTESSLKERVLLSRDNRPWETFPCLNMLDSIK